MIGRATKMSCLLARNNSGVERRPQHQSGALTTTLTNTPSVVNRPTCYCCVKQTRPLRPTANRRAWFYGSHVHSKRNHASRGDRESVVSFTRISEPGEHKLNKFYLAAFLLCAFPLAAQEHQDPSAEPRTMPLWDDKAPGALGDADSDRPTITLYAASTGDGPTAAVIVFPGGSYGYLATNHEGRQPANWLNAMGLVAFVVKYRIGPRYHHPIELGDAQRAIRVVRARAKEFGVSPDKIGVMGFSAGGHLASTAATHFDSGNPQSSDPIEHAGCRPDFAILAYPVISFTA